MSLYSFGFPACTYEENTAGDEMKLYSLGVPERADENVDKAISKIDQVIALRQKLEDERERHAKTKLIGYVLGLIIVIQYTIIKGIF